MCPESLLGAHSSAQLWSDSRRPTCSLPEPGNTNSDPPDPFTDSNLQLSPSLDPGQRDNQQTGCPPTPAGPSSLISSSQRLHTQCCPCKLQGGPPLGRAPVQYPSQSPQKCESLILPFSPAGVPSSGRGVGRALCTFLSSARTNSCRPCCSSSPAHTCWSVASLGSSASPRI